MNVINSSASLIILKMEFLAIIFLVIYVGAIAVLFLFIIMMLNVRLIETNEHLLSYFPFVLSIILLILLQTFFATYKLYKFSNFKIYNFNSWIELLFFNSNIKIIGNTLYTFYFYLFLFCGLILLVAMISSIVVTSNIKTSNNLKKQNIFKQISINFEKQIEC